MSERMQFSDERYKRAMVFIYILTLFVQILDVTIVNVAIPTLADAFGVSDTQIDRTIISYLVGLAVFIPASGWLADRYGSRRVFLVSLTMFTLASALCGMSQTLAQLVLFRAIQGAGAGIMGPLGSTMLYRAFPQKERARAATAVISVAVIAPAVGPLAGGLIVDSFNWRWIFFVNVPIGAISFVVAALIIRDYKGEVKAPFDFIGFLLAGVGLGATLFGITVARDQGWTSSLVLGSIFCGIVSLVALPLVERRMKHPLLRFELFRAPIFRSIQVVCFPTYAAHLGTIFLLPVYLQSLRGFSALESGFALIPHAFGVWIAAQVVGRILYVRIGPRRLMFAGLGAALVAGLTLVSFDHGTSLWTIQLLILVRGFALGTAFVSIQTAIYAQTSVADTAQASALYSANRQSAPAFGVALAAAVLAASAGGLAEPVLADYRLSFLILALLFVPAIIAVWWVRDEDAAATLSKSVRRAT